MILHSVAAGLLALSVVHYAMSGGFSRFLIRNARVSAEGDFQGHNPNALLGAMAVVLLWGCAIALLLVPGIPAAFEIGLGMFVILGPVAAMFYRRTTNVRTIMLLLAGVLILSGVLF